MNKNREILLVAIISIGFILLAIEYKKGYQPPKLWEPIKPQYRSSRERSKDLGILLRDYFSENEKSAATTQQRFIEYAVETEYFGSFPPPQGYESEYDLSFYLIWPENIKSANPQLVAYTQPFTKLPEKDLSVKYRCLLFFRGNDFIEIIMRESLADEIIGNDNLKDEPDLYFWLKYDSYLMDEKRMKEFPVDSVPNRQPIP